jgi:hypothetical protein
MYKFTYTKDPSNRFDHADIEHSIDSVVASDLVEAFYRFMLGAGYHPTSVAEALQQVASDYLPEEDSEEKE